MSAPGVFDVLKGLFLQGGAIDKTLPTVDVDLNRGSLVVEDAGYWKKASTATLSASTVVYVVLTPSDRVSAQAGSRFSSGTVDSASGLGMVSLRDGTSVAPIGVNRNNSSNITAGSFLLTAVPLNAPGEYRLSQIIPTNLTASGIALTVDSSTNTLKRAANGNFVVAITTDAAAKTYQNDLPVGNELEGAPMLQGGFVDTVTVRNVPVPYAYSA